MDQLRLDRGASAGVPRQVLPWLGLLSLLFDQVLILRAVRNKYRVLLFPSHGGDPGEFYVR